jgi:hypothetical protein
LRSAADSLPSAVNASPRCRTRSAAATTARRGRAGLAGGDRTGLQFAGVGQRAVDQALDEAALLAAEARGRLAGGVVEGADVARRLGVAGGGQRLAAVEAAASWGFGSVAAGDEACGSVVTGGRSGANMVPGRGLRGNGASGCVRAPRCGPSPRRRGVGQREHGDVASRGDAR